MKKQRTTSSYHKYVILVALTLSLNGCVEPFVAETIDFESALVVEATITDELRTQEVLLSRTFRFQDDRAQPENNADVRVVDDNGDTFTFRELEPGIYQSVSEFASVPGVSYQLLIETQDGRNYSSSPVTMGQPAIIEDLRVDRIVNDNGEDGMGIFVDSFDPSGSARNFRYTYEETFKIIAPRWTPNDLEGDPSSTCGVLKVPKQQEERVCYKTELSNSIIFETTENLNEGRVENFMVRFINRENYIISHRYSILIKQLVHSDGAFAFYETLNEFSSSESLFSETQPGFLQGNITSTENTEERVLGYFDVAAFDEHRIFFNYEDFYPGEALPPYIDTCQEIAPPISDVAGCVLRPLIELNLAKFLRDNDSPALLEGPYFIVPQACGDCTALGSNEIPNFWLE